MASSRACHFWYSYKKNYIKPFLLSASFFLHAKKWNSILVCFYVRCSSIMPQTISIFLIDTWLRNLHECCGLHRGYWPYQIFHSYKRTIASWLYKFLWFLVGCTIAYSWSFHEQCLFLLIWPAELIRMKRNTVK